MNTYLEKIVQQLLEGVPDGWKRLVLRAIYDDDACDIKYFVSEDGSRYIDCHNLGIPMQELIQILSNAEDEISELRESMEKDAGLFITITLVVDDTGHAKADFGYDDVNEDFGKYCTEWEEKYLK